MLQILRPQSRRLGRLAAAGGAFCAAFSFFGTSGTNRSAKSRRRLLNFMPLLTRRYGGLFPEELLGGAVPRRASGSVGTVDFGKLGIKLLFDAVDSAAASGVCT